MRNGSRYRVVRSQNWSVWYKTLQVVHEQSGHTYSEKCIHMVYKTYNCGFVDSWRNISESTATNGTDGVGNGVYGGMERRKGYT